MSQKNGYLNKVYNSSHPGPILWIRAFSVRDESKDNEDKSTKKPKVDVVTVPTASSPQQKDNEVSYVKTVSIKAECPENDKKTPILNVISVKIKDKEGIPVEKEAEVKLENVKEKSLHSPVQKLKDIIPSLKKEAPKIDEGTYHCLVTLNMWVILKGF